MNYIDSFQCYLQEERKRHRTIQEYVASVVALEKWVVESTDEKFIILFLLFHLHGLVTGVLS
ncbi:hypothetical protein P4377_27305 [Bacillus thuringiensis]|nr:hypothetical protein [Bacillus thuringiensis]